jgi:ribonucleoside-triphosphate reductase
METRSLEAIDKDIAKVKRELANVKGNETEVYARIVGYYRSVRNWNKGKKDEFKHRKEFVMADGAPQNNSEGAYYITEADAGSACCAAQRVNETEKSAPSVSRYEFYSRKTCPNCPGVHDYLASSALNGAVIDVDTPDGIQKATDNGVYAAPTVIMYNDAGEEIIRVHNRKELAFVVPREAIAV